MHVRECLADVDGVVALLVPEDDLAVVDADDLPAVALVLTRHLRRRSVIGFRQTATKNTLIRGITLHLANINRAVKQRIIE